MVTDDEERRKRRKLRRFSDKSRKVSKSEKELINRKWPKILGYSGKELYEKNNKKKWAKLSQKQKDEWDEKSMKRTLKIRRNYILGYKVYKKEVTRLRAKVYQLNGELSRLLELEEARTLHNVPMSRYGISQKMPI